MNWIECIYARGKSIWLSNILYRHFSGLIEFRVFPDLQKLNLEPFSPHSCAATSSTAQSNNLIIARHLIMFEACLILTTNLDCGIFMIWFMCCCLKQNLVPIITWQHTLLCLINLDISNFFDLRDMPSVHSTSYSEKC